MKAFTRSILVLLVLAAFLTGPTGIITGAALGRLLDSKQTQATGEPYKVPVDCNSAVAVRATIERLSAGLPVQDDAMKRTEALIESARNEGPSLDATERTKQLEETASDLRKLASDLATTSEALRERVKALKQAGLSQRERRNWLEKIDSIEKLGDYLEKLPVSFKAGYDFGAEIQSRSHTALELVSQLNKLFVDSGIAAEALGMAGDVLGGPLGAMTFSAFKIVIDISILRASRALSEDEYRKAMDNYVIMRNQHLRVKEIITRLESDLKICQESASIKPKDQPTIRDKGHGIGAGTILLIGAGVAAAGAGIAIRNGKASCGPSPGDEVNAACLSVVFNSAACQAALAKMRTYCQCSGFQTFNATAGSCQ